MSSEPDSPAPGRPGETAKGGTAAVARRLARARSRARLSLMFSALTWLVCGAIAYLIVAGALDYTLRMPDWMRGGALIVALTALAVAARRWLLPAWTFRPSLTEVALRVERTPEAKRAGLAGVLASGLEFDTARSAMTPAAAWMSSRAVEDAARRFDSIGRVPLLRRDRNAAGLLLLAATAGVAAAATWSAGRDLALTGLTRVAAPWVSVEWPKRTEIADATALDVHAIGSALPLRAAMVRSDIPADRARVEARYRVIRDGEPGPIQRATLAPQFKPVTIGVGATTVTGALFEQLVEPGVSGLSARGTESGPRPLLALEYWFETLDDATEPRRIPLVEPPAVAGATARVTPPAYAAEATGGARARFVGGEHDLGAGDDQRAIVGPVLAGSVVELAVRFNKPLPPPGDLTEPAARDAWLARAMPGVAFGDGARLAATGDAWSVAWTLRGTTRVPIAARDEFGLGPRDESVFTFDAVEDRAPTAAVTLPEQDEVVLATAIIDAAGEARDDVGVASLTLEAQPARRPSTSMGVPPEAAGDPAPISTGPAEGRDATQWIVAGRVALEGFTLKPGDELWLYAVATDGYDAGGLRHDAVRSAPRKLRVVTEDELVGQMRRELQGLRQAAIRLDQDQGELIAATGRGFVSEEERRRQGGLGPRLEQQAKLAEQLLDRAERNALDDAGLTGLLEDVREQLDAARQSAEQAGARLDRAAQDSPSPEHAELTPEDAREAQKDQNDTRDRLGNVIDMLDRGEDGWAARRELQRLLERQRDLAARTAETGRRTVGREPGDLSPREREELDRISREQEQLADQARAAMDTLAQRAEQMRQTDAAQSAAMQQAAQRGRQSQVPERMDQAAQEARQNQTGSAQEQQQQAMDAMEQMLDDLENADRDRDESLRRLLASLIESLDGLIAQQEAELMALAAARAGNAALEGLDAGMIRVNRNTLGVLGESKAAFREMQKVAQLIGQAAESQADAVAALRAAPIDADGADRDEQSSLRDLRAAKAEAQRVEAEAEQRDQDRKRQELRRVYRDTLEQQVALRDETTPMLGRDADRRERLKLRGLGERQDTLRQGLDELRKSTEELGDAAVFGFAHDQLDAVMGAAAKKLRAGQSTAAVGRDQDAAVNILRALVEALADSANQEDQFQDAEGGDESGGEGQGGSQPPPLIPDMAELRLLKGLQQQAAASTRALDEARDSALPAELEALGRLQQNLAERAQALIEKLEQRPGGDPPAENRP